MYPAKSIVHDKQNNNQDMMTAKPIAWSSAIKSDGRSVPRNHINFSLTNGFRIKKFTEQDDSSTSSQVNPKSYCKELNNALS